MAASAAGGTRTRPTQDASRRPRGTDISTGWGGTDGSRAPSRFAVLLANPLAKLAVLLLEVFRVCAQGPHCPARQAAVFPDHSFADLVEGPATKLHDMKSVETDLSTGEVLAGTVNERLGHVHSDILDL